MNLNSKIIKLSGKAELSPEQNLENGQSVTIVCEGQIVSVQENDLQDGTFDRVYKFKVSTLDIK